MRDEFTDAHTQITGRLSLQDMIGLEESSEVKGESETLTSSFGSPKTVGAEEREKERERRGE